MKNQQNNSKYLGNDYTDKSTDSARLIQSVRKLFLSGDKFTAKQLNALVGFNDARKTISVLRHKEGWKIEDCRLSNGCKLYWLAEKGGANE
ncbi:hypothetical protein [Bacteroides eggerthii]|uniref:hypothetical protein n=1 Tax=Bacteroides eggerthii TaxID=28111 RepID=UPI0022DF6869|nr:hypothetical protein [Bacteroides eggerthii]